ncbi:hypothetical protein P885DRAFT_81212 [Corynascus similis CBS 632.67]
MTRDIEHEARETQPLFSGRADVGYAGLSGHEDSCGLNSTADGSRPSDETVKTEEALGRLRDKLKFILPALAIGIFLAAGDQTIIVSSYGRIRSDLGELDKSACLATAYLCTTTAFQPLYGMSATSLAESPAFFLPTLSLD